MCNVCGISDSETLYQSMQTAESSYVSHLYRYL